MKFTIQIDAIPQGRPRVYNKVAVDPPKSRKFKQDFALLLLRETSQYAVPFTGEVKVELHIFRNFNSKTHARYGDIDNLVKSIFDALTGVLWKDDKQVVELHVTKNLSDTPHVELSIEEVW